MKDLYEKILTIQNATIRIEALKNHILDICQDILCNDFIKALPITKETEVILEYHSLTFSKKLQDELKKYNISIDKNKIIIDCSTINNNFDGITYLKRAINQQLLFFI